MRDTNSSPALSAVTALKTNAQKSEAGLRSFVEDVANGDIMEYCVVYKVRGGDWCTFASETDNRQEMIGELEFLKHRIIIKQ